MRIAGAWVGLGLGDASPEVARLKDHLRRKFSYAKKLTFSTHYDLAMVEVVTEMQSRYEAAGQLPADKYIPGVVNVETKYVCGFLPRPAKLDERPVLFTVCGTGVPWWVGPDADTAKAVEDVYRWQPIGYRAAPFPMAPSAREGRAELVTQIERHRPQIERGGAAMIGYSQGAIVTSECWMFDINPQGGRLHWLKPYLRKAVTFGNPMRQQGSVWADPGGASASVTSYGIADQLMTDTPDWWRDYAHKGDLYTDVEGQSGEYKTAIYKVVMGAKIMQGPDSLLSQILELTQAPVREMTAMFGAILDAGMFFAAKTGPHINYAPSAAIGYLRAL